MGGLGDWKQILNYVFLIFLHMNSVRRGIWQYRIYSYDLHIIENYLWYLIY